MAAKWPEAKYTRCDRLCLYDKGKVENGPDFEGCIFGQAFRIIGPMIPVDFTKKNWPGFIGTMDVKSIHKLLIDYYGLSEYAKNYINWCDVVQSHQDNGLTWSEGVALADKDHPISV